MEKRKRNDNMHWVPPGVLSGNAKLQNLVEHVSITKQADDKESKPVSQDKLAELEKKVKSLESQVLEWEQRWAKFVKAAQQEREHLYTIVLLLKKEWEMERDEHRHR